MTPRTSWWESTAERVGGIVAWVTALEHASQRVAAGHPCRRIHAFATCAHELGHLGLHRVLTDNAEFVPQAAYWLHLGANLGCSSDRNLTIRATDPADAAHMRRLLLDAGYPASGIATESIEHAMGEARDLVDHGAKVLSIIGRNGRFHAPSDRWPANVDAQAVASIATATAAWIDSLHSMT